MSALIEKGVEMRPPDQTYLKHCCWEKTWVNCIGGILSQADEFEFLYHAISVPLLAMEGR